MLNISVENNFFLYYSKVKIKRQSKRKQKQNIELKKEKYTSKSIYKNELLTVRSNSNKQNPISGLYREVVLEKKRNLCPVPFLSFESILYHFVSSVFNAYEN